LLSSYFRFMAKRGASENPKSRFERIGVEPEPDEAAALADGVAHLETRLLHDPSRSILATNQSPDVGFDVSINPYRGCMHGCVYCYARPTHEYLGFSAGLDFETRILVKLQAPALLRKALAAPRWKPQVIALSGVTDAYQPAERRLEITRGCLEVLAEFRNPVAIVTKSRLVTRDLDLLGELASWRAAAVNLSITSLDPRLQQRMEPRASAPQQRLAAIEALARAGVPVGVMVAPIIPGLNDHEVPRILQAAADAGACSAAHIVLRLPHGLKDLFGAWLSRHYPERRNKVLNRVREVRGGRLNDARFGTRMRGQGLYAEQVRALFHSAARRAGLDSPPPPLSTAAFRRPGAEQLGLFG
jgi:DNA repair photolyase